MPQRRMPRISQVKAQLTATEVLSQHACDFSQSGEHLCLGLDTCHSSQDHSSAQLLLPN